MYYSREDDEYSYLFLDSSSGEIGEAQFEWIAASIHTGKQPVLFLHHPVIPVAAAIDRLYYLKDRQRLLALLKTVDKDVHLFCGHYHMNHESVDKNVKQVITPAASFQLKKNLQQVEIDNSSFGYRVIHLNKGNIHTELVLFPNNSQ